jgi:hypothetical protein
METVATDSYLSVTTDWGTHDLEVRLR